MTDITRSTNLNPSRRHRTYPRAVKRYRHNFYRARKPGEHGTRHHSPPTIQLTIPAPASATMINLS